MSTRSVIAKMNPNGSVTGVYCHWDGYPEHNGKILLENYSDKTKLSKLIENGAISSLRSRIGTKHNFDNPPKNETTFYHRDRGDNLSVSSWKNVQEMMDSMYDCEFFYVYDDCYLFTGEWLLCDKTGFSPVKNYI